MTSLNHDAAASPQAMGDHSAGRFQGKFSLADVVLALGSIVIYVLLDAFSFLHEADGFPVTPWNPGLGVMFALLVARGPIYGSVLFVGVLLVEWLILRTELRWYAALGIAVIVACSYTLVALAVRKLPRFDATHLRARDVLAVVLAGGVGAIIVTALLTIMLLSLGLFEIGGLSKVAFPMIVGDMIGIAVVTPFLLRLRLFPRHLQVLDRPYALLEAAGIVVAIAVALWLATRPVVPGAGNMFYVLFLPTVIAAVRYGFDGACSALLLVQLGLVGLIQFHDIELGQFTDYQLRLLVLTLTALLVGMLVSERQALDEEARRTAFKLQEAQAEAARAARLNLASGMAAALAHELNQPMTAARALTRTAQQLVSQSSGDLARVESNLEAAVDQIDHAAAVVRQMREFLRRGESQTMPVDIAKAVGDALVLVQPVASVRGIALDLDIDGPLPFVAGNRVQLQQVIINLVNNSMDSIAETKRADGRVTVVSKCSRLRNEIEIKVQDNGMGIPRERMTDIFEPLMTSRENGIGLGLSICQSIIQAHHGRIWVSSGDAGATEMTIVLPVMSQPIRKSEQT